MIAVVAYEGMTALDAIGPFEVLRFLPDAQVELVASVVGAVATDAANLTLTATRSFEQTPAPDVIVVPGGPGTGAAMSGPVVDWLRTSHTGSRWTTSVCSGSLILAAAGLLSGLDATSHFAVREHLSAFGARPVSERVVMQRRCCWSTHPIRRTPRVRRTEPASRSSNEPSRSATRTAPYPPIGDPDQSATGTADATTSVAGCRTRPRDAYRVRITTSGRMVGSRGHVTAGPVQLVSGVPRAQLREQEHFPRSRRTGLSRPPRVV